MLDVAMEHILKYWIGWACGILASMVAVLWRRFTKFKKENEGMHNGLLSLLRDRINQACRFHLRNKHITARDREVLDAMFQSYFDMGGNGVIKHLKEEINALPTWIENIH